MGIACSHCGTVLPVEPEEARGAVLYCGRCGQVVTAAPAAPVARPAPARGHARVVRDRPGRAPTRPTGRAHRGGRYPRRSSSSLPLILGVGGGVAAVVVGVLLVLLLSDHREGAPSPTAAVRAYYDALQAGDIDRMKGLVCEADLPRFEKQVDQAEKMGIDLGKFMKQVGSTLRGSGSLRIVDQVIDGDRATVVLEVVYNGKTVREKQPVVREDGMWWVSLATLP